MSKYLSYNQIANMSYNKLVRALDSGETTVQQLKSAYSYLRGKAIARERRVSQENIVNEFGNTDREYFTKLKNIITPNNLLHELADVNRFLSSNRSTVTGLKKQRQNTINAAEKLGFDVDKDNYKDFIKFMKWFKSSEYSKKYDSDSEEVQEIFNSSTASVKDWAKAFALFVEKGSRG